MALAVHFLRIGLLETVLLKNGSQGNPTCCGWHRVSLPLRHDHCERYQFVDVITVCI